MWLRLWKWKASKLHAGYYGHHTLYTTELGIRKVQRNPNSGKNCLKMSVIRVGAFQARGPGSNPGRRNLWRAIREQQML